MSEEAYKAMERINWKRRLLDEKKELKDRIKKLRAFIDKPTDRLTMDQLDLLLRQEKAMLEYYEVLEERCKLEEV